MAESWAYRGLNFFCAPALSRRACYVLLPEGLRDDVLQWMDAESKRCDVSIVVVTGMDWDNDLTPWPAAGVFRKAKPFGGLSEIFLKDLTEDIIPSVEEHFGLRVSTRSLAGVSLSGLFAIWSAFVTGTFESIISISGSLWYDGFADWAEGRAVSSSVRKIYVSLGDREKNSKDARMSTVQTQTERVVESLKSSGTETVWLLEADTTHFSPIVPRLEKAFERLFIEAD